VKLDRKKIEKLVRALKEKGAILEPSPQNVAFNLRLGNGNLLIYNSGAIAYSGKEKTKVKNTVIEEILKLENLPKIGCDETGKGEFFGPLVLSCICADESCLRELLNLEVKDSKKLNKAKIRELAFKIKQKCTGIVRTISPEKYNKLYSEFKNVNRLLERQYAEILKKLVGENCNPKEIVMDKFSKKVENLIRNNFPYVKVSAITSGERDPVVAAASIIAKNERLNFLERTSKELGFEVLEGNVNNRALLKKIPKELRYKYVKLHFNVGE